MNALDPLYILAGALAAPVWARKQRSGWGERMGKVAGMLRGEPAPSRPRILLHAVSVGEVNALRPLVPLLERHATVIVSVTTDTGLARARQLFSETCEVVRYPLDFSWAVRRFLDAVRPDAVGLVELELWPNFLGACRARGIPACVINGRLSARSFRGYARWRRLLSPLMFRRLACAAVQDETYAERFRAMGAPDVRVTGSMKWDSYDVSDEPGPPGDAALALGRELGIDPDRPLVVGGSTGPGNGTGEEALLHEAVLRSCPEGTQLACAPRKPERFEEAAGTMPGCVRRSRGGGDPFGGRFLLDTIGELGLLYQLADVVVVGRSFYHLHGSDPVEPIALGRATVIGPAVGDFEEIVRAFEDAGGLVRADRETLGPVLRDLLADGERRRELVARGRACIREHQGGAARHAELLLGLVRSE
ncbi:MAG: 3-deoxy-D-manno-octulosonic acid transferase [Phycisphaerales bacterium JB040]